MSWATLGTSARVTIAALAATSLIQFAGTLTEPEFNTAAGLAIALVFLGLAGVVFTGRWWALAVVTAFSLLLTVAAIGQVTRAFDEGETGELLRVLSFQALTLTAAIAGFIATLQSYRRSHAGKQELDHP